MKTFHIQKPDEAIKEALIDKINNLTKPKGSLGRLEEIALQIGLIQQSLSPRLPDLEANPPEAVKKLAERKAGAVVQEVLGEGYTGMAAIIGADTMVVCDGEIFGKPASISDAKRMLRRLQGNTHEVLTGVSVWLVSAPNAEDVSLGFRTFVDRAAVTFHPQTDEQLAEYLQTYSRKRSSTL